MGYFFHYEFPDMFLGSLLYILLVVLSDSKMKRKMMMMKSLCVVETDPIVTDFGSLTLTVSVHWKCSDSGIWTFSVSDSLTWIWTVSVSDSWTVSVLDSWTWSVSVAFLDSLTWTWTVSVSVAVLDSWTWTVSVSVSDSWIWTVSVLDYGTWTECCSSWMDCGFWSDSVWLTVFCLFDSYHDSAVSVLE